MLRDNRLISHSMIRKIVAMGNSTYFWKEIWIGNEKLTHLFLRLYALDIQHDCIVKDRWSVMMGF